MSGKTGNIDQNVFLQIAEGNEAAFRVVFHEYNAILYHTIKKIIKSEEEAREIIQEVFLRLWVYRHTLPQVKNPGGWLHTIASNLCVDALRKQARNPGAAGIPPLENTGQTDLNPSHFLEGKEVQELVNEAISKLPASRKKIFELSRKHQLNRKQIADQLNLSESTVKNQLTASLKFIQDYLNKKGNLSFPLEILILIFFTSR